MKTWLLAVSVLMAFDVSAEARQPSVVIFYIDDMCEGALGCYGSQLNAPTPNIDAIAAAGVRFTSGYVSACMCSPSRAGLMTGRYQQRTGHDGNTAETLDLGEVTFAQRMKTAGYATGITGKWHLGHDAAHLPAARGFDTSFGSVANLGAVDEEATAAARADLKANKQRDRQIAKGKKRKAVKVKIAADFFRGSELIKSPGYEVTSPMFADEAVKFIDAHRAEPFFLYVPFNATHAPTYVSEHWLAKMKSFGKDAAKAGQVAELDEAIGTVMQKLRELKLEEDTLVFVIADNGGGGSNPYSNGLRSGKWSLWEGGIRVPFLVQWKGHIKPGQVSDEPVIQLDVLPTALAAAGVEIDPKWQLDGVNLLPLLEGKTKHIDRALFWRQASPKKGVEQLAVRQGDWKLVRGREEGSKSAGKEPQLINLAKDRGEEHDVAAEHPERVKAMQKMWEGWNAQMAPPR
jgi:arylsulfatase A-like enzyme